MKPPLVNSPQSAIRNPQSAILQMRGITKSFPGARALAGVDFAARRGEVHALVGENGAGKSTLMKILAGVVRKDGGEISFDGREINPQNAAAAQALGVSLVHQELSLAPNLTVAENIFVRREPRRRSHLRVARPDRPRQIQRRELGGPPWRDSGACRIDRFGAH